MEWKIKIRTTQEKQRRQKIEWKMKKSKTEKELEL